MLTERFLKNIRENHLFSGSDKLLLAVSGGVDSVVLAELCRRCGFDFEIAHVNFQLRGEESFGDEQFVASIADKYKVPFHIKRFDTAAYAEDNRLSVQVAARELRYAWFNELLQNGPRYLLTAHHLNDNVETVMMNFFRGTGISGLRGILPVKNRIIRPMLIFTREEIHAFAGLNSLHWREDSSNASEKYTRNYFRQTVIPAVGKIFPDAERNIADSIKRFRDVELIYEGAIERYKKELLEIKGKEVHIPVLKLKRYRPLDTIIYELLKPFKFSPSQTTDIVHLLDADQGKFVQSPTHRIIRNRSWLIIAERESTEANYILIEEGTEELLFSKGRLRMTVHGSADIVANANIALLDMREIRYPLILRPKKQGDYFYPLGMRRKKKISRFLIDQKLSPVEKENIWVLESDRRICWIAGLRIDDRFKVTAETKGVLRIELIPEQ